MALIATTGIPRREVTSPAVADANESKDDEATVFISYSRRDLVFVDRLDADLQARGIKTLVDRAAIEVGEYWLARLHPRGRLNPGVRRPRSVPDHRLHQPGTDAVRHLIAGLSQAGFRVEMTDPQV